MNAYVHGGSAAPRKTKRVFLLSGTANEGEAVCYNWDALTVTAENDTLSGNLATNSAADWTDARRTMVEVPSQGNNLHFAGVVDRASDGVVGPNWITIHEPGSVCKVRTVSTVSIGIGSTGSMNQADAMLTFNISTNSVGGAGTNNARFEIGGFMGEGSATLLAEGTASVPNDSYLKMAHLHEGPPSGGVQGGSLITLALADSSVLIPHGVINMDNTDLTTEAETAATISVNAGKFVGQKLAFIGPTAANSVAVAVSFLTGVIPMSSVTFISVTQATLSDPAEFLTMEWTGARWLCATSGGIT